MHELGSALFAIAGALFFGLGFGRVLQLVHMRAWRVSVPTRATDQGLYAAVLLALYGLIVLFLFQLNELSGNPSGRAGCLRSAGSRCSSCSSPGRPRFCSMGRSARETCCPEPSLTAVGLVVITVVSRFVMEAWINLYASDYGGLGVVLAIYFWIAFYSFVIVGAASLAPALAQRRSAARLGSRP